MTERKTQAACVTFGCRARSDGVGVLLAQLGTPDEPTSSALRRYLKQFLADPRVIEANRVVWWAVLNGIILNTRPKRSAALYSRIWRENGSPLLTITQSLTVKLRAILERECGVSVEFGMRYGAPPLEDSLDRLIQQGCSRILLVPLYPQYSGPTTASTYDAVFAHLLKRRWVPTLRVVAPYFRDPRYLGAVAQLVNRELAKGAPDRLLVSYHGIPKRYIDAGDPYCCHCTETTRALLPLLSFPKERTVQTYQSRFGREPWLIPYTEVTLRSLAEEGVEKVVIACPGFTCDCLETLDELGNEGKRIFTEHGGKELRLVPCLNDDDVWVKGLSEMIDDELAPWLIGPECGATVTCPVEEAKARGIEA